MNGRSDDSLDPKSWSDFRVTAHRLLDACIDQLEGAREHAWRKMPATARSAVSLGDANVGVGMEQVATEMLSHVLPYGSGNTHPRFFGWVNGTGLASGLLAEIVAATMNSNLGGRDHGAVYVEREVIQWSLRTFGFPETASGVLVTGTSQATVVALAVARNKALGASSRKGGTAGGPKLTAYALQGVHNAIVKALELLGIGSDALRRIPAKALGAGMDLVALEAEVAKDRAAGMQPFCIIGTAGSVDSGVFDDFGALADLCAREQIWLHVDGAFGAWTKIAGAPYSELSRGMERADSIATDFHKWMYVQYDCGMVLVRDEKDHRAAFAARPSYLAAQSDGLGGGEPWFCDYGTDLSRGFRALKVWAALRCHGRQALGHAVHRNCELATEMGRLVASSSDLELMAPVTSNVCIFSVKGADENGSPNDVLAQQLQLRGEAVFSTTKMGTKTVLRAAITNHRTRDEDIALSLDAVREAHARLRSAG